MTTTALDPRGEVGIAPAQRDEAAWGWYLYGITRRGPPAAALADANAALMADTTSASGDVATLQVLECCGLAALVRQVRLADFGVAAMEERLRRASELEAMVRSHNSVIEAIHARRAILPARLGVVYSQSRDILSALRSACDTLLPQLHRLEGCDEWALHLYADRTVVRERVATRDPAIAPLRAEWAAARPGRAYFLERRLRDLLETATRNSLLTLGQSTFERLSSLAAAGQVSTLRQAADSASEVEILRAAFLVERDCVGYFASAVQSASDAAEGLRCECSGPWPPYSFAVVDVEGRK